CRLAKKGSFMAFADISLDSNTSGRSGSSEFQSDRTPPQDLLAEQSTLGAMMLSKDAVADVIEEVRGIDFYQPRHEIIYDAILALYSRGEPTDVITVTD